MEDLSAMLSQLLDDPQGMDKIKSLASSLLEGGGFPAPGESPPASASGGGEGFSLSPGEMQKIMRLVGAFKNTGEDDRTRLLLSLKPHLSESRRQRVDQAVQLLKMISLLPLIQESGLF